jgi:two-component sensor histidine kinase
MINPPQTMSTLLVAVPRAAGDARAFTTLVLGAWGLSHLVETTELLVSELVTNAIKHAGGIMDPPGDLTKVIGKIPPVMLSISHCDALLVQVWDVSDEPVVRRTADDDDVDGRGLDLVDALARKWGCEVLESGGKIVWFVLDTEKSGANSFLQ